MLLYFYATRLFGWWAPSDALIHPDVLASYFPWLSAIANSLQAGFWEESLFRAVPIAGAALIGDRFGKRNLFIVIAFVVQAIVFGAGHAPYPTQPSYSRPVELILPSIGFGLLYLCFGLLPGIILHYTFDVVWFALPLFVSTARGHLDRSRDGGRVDAGAAVGRRSARGCAAARGSSWHRRIGTARGRRRRQSKRRRRACPSRTEPSSPADAAVRAGVGDRAGWSRSSRWVAVDRFRPMAPALRVSRERRRAHRAGCADRARCSGRTGLAADASSQ